eukprot:2745437-Amphidinium_carterae.1
MSMLKRVLLGAQLQGQCSAAVHPTTCSCKSRSLSNGLSPAGRKGCNSCLDYLYVGWVVGGTPKLRSTCTSRMP